ncbi:uncharacterized protein [Lepeophtheirus salmonis]|uniref:uncharacterized protein n=1 Tax=Lepeophtheirus salmonis TaxID=72036 RepID=UPI003AF35AB6
MKSFTALAVLLVIGSSTASYLSPYVGGHGYGYPGYAPYAVPAVKIPAPEKTELKVETIEAPKAVDYAYATPYATPYIGGYAAHHAAPYVAGYAAPYVAGYTAHHAAPYAAGYVAHHAAPYAAGYVAPHAAPYAAGYGYPASSQFHSQDEFGNLKFGYSNINSAKHEHGNTYGGVAGGYQYVDANGVLQSVSYVADGLGFRTVDSRLPVAPAVPEAEPLVQAPAPVFEGKQIPDTPEVAAAKAEFQKTFDEAVAAGGDWDLIKFLGRNQFRLASQNKQSHIYIEMNTLTAFATLLVIGFTQGGFVSPYYRYGFPVYAPYANYAHAVNVPSPHITEHKVHNIEAPKNVANEYVSPYMAYFPSPHVASYAAPLAKSYVPVVKNEEHKVEEESKDVSTFVSPYNAYFLTPSYTPSVKTLRKVVKKVTPFKAVTHVSSYAAPHVPAIAPTVKNTPVNFAPHHALNYVSPYAAPVAGQFYAAGFGYPASSQFHSQDELGNLQFGYSNINSAKYEQGNTYSGVNGGYQYVDANGVLQTVTYVADDFGFRTVDSRLPTAPLKAPVFERKPVSDTPAVVAAKAEFKKAFDTAKAAAAVQSA